MKSEKIGLALGSGAARGWAHLGVLRALDEAGIAVDCVAGTSMGALVGAVYVSGRIDLLEEFALGMNWRQIVSFLDVVLPKSGLIDGKKIEAFFRQQVEETRFEDLLIPFAAVATELRSGSAVILNQGDLIKVVRASISIPGIFTPVLLDGRVLVDGGLVNPVPVTVARSLGATKVIAVDLNHTLLELPAEKAPDNIQKPSADAGEPEASSWARQLRTGLNQRAGSLHPVLSKQIKIWNSDSILPSIFDTLGMTINIMEVRITEMNLKMDPPDLLIRPKLADFMFMDFHRSEEAIEAGYKATMAALDEWEECP
ncbi:MAG: patatin-like phospholipase family protein [Deltaproteobacteria bacterium]|nr:patatin-like phospholipase family protein [Deltaproteobacteria bacterium]